MNRFYKKVGIIFVMAFAIMLGSFSNVLATDDAEVGTTNLNNTTENSAKVGETLLKPEKGWKRYDNTNSKINYIGDWNERSSGLSYWCYNGTDRVSTSPGNVCKFSFEGSKLRLIAQVYTGSSKNVTVLIDNIPHSYSAYGDNNSRMILLFEQNNLNMGLHNVRIISNDKQWCEIDAVDIDENGELKSYSEDSVSKTILNVEPEKNKIHLNEGVTASLTIDNIKDIAAEDVRIKYDNSKLQFLGVDEVEGIKLVKQLDSQPGELRFIIASKGEKNIANAKKALLKLRFKGIAAGEALVDVIKGRVSDGIEMEDDLTDEQCGQATITIDENALKDVNNSGGFTLLDLGIDARHMGKDPKSAELAKYNTDVIANNAIDDADLLEIGKLMLENPDYKF